jgi:uncharacterized protein (DUF305 family)
MATTRRNLIASFAWVGVLSASAIVYRVTAQSGDHDSHHGDNSTPEAVGCEVPMGTPGMTGHGDMTGTPGASPRAGMIEFDLAYIDMMIPHHESVIALAEVAVDMLQDERLIAIAEAIIETQPAEIEELASLREEWYGSPDPAPMSDEIMAVSMGIQHGCGEQGHLQQMSAEWQVEQFERAEDKDLAFIDQVIPHHQMAIDTSEVSLVQAEHQEIRDIAERVIAQQQIEIDELEAIRADLEGTPAA